MDVLAPAKINLFLRVVGRRSDGYHNLISLMCPIDRYDRLTLTPVAHGFDARCAHPEVPSDSTNLAARAAALFYAHLGLPGGVSIAIEKSIPVGGGLGGGSSDAAAVLWALNQQFDRPCTPDVLATLAVRLGADVPFFIHGRPAIAEGIGDQLTPYPGPLPEALVVVFPGIAVNTAGVYKKLNLALTKCQNQPKSIPLNRGSFQVAEHLCNDLETVVLPEYPQIAHAKDALLDAGASGALMSGSGACVFGIFPNMRAAETAKQRLEGHHAGTVFPARIVSDPSAWR